MSSEIMRKLKAACKEPDIFTRDATGEKYMRVGKRLVALKGLDPEGRPVISCDIERTPNVQGGVDVTVKPRSPISLHEIPHEPGVEAPG